MSEVLSAKAVPHTSLPVIDVAGLASADPLQRAAVGAALHAACIDKGFFYIANHGIEPVLIDAARAEAERFFALSDAEKRQVDFYIGNELPLDHPRVVARAFNCGPNQWPQQSPGFRPAMEAYFAALFDLSKRLTRGLALSLDLPEDHFDAFCDEAMGTLRLLHYPPQPAQALPEQKGCGAHTDFGCLTLLWQDAIGGLQVQDSDGGWIHVPPLPGTFVVNLGDLIARWTNDRYRSTLHRVVNASGRERYSMPFFFTGRPDYVVTCLPGCTVDGEAPKYPPITVVGHLEACYRRTYG
jgi:isopenicillin N synthase-like dioxygenase